MAVANNNEIEKRLWEAADELRANSKLRAADYSAPVQGLIFLRYGDTMVSQVEKMLTAGEQASTSWRRGISKLSKWGFFFRGSKRKAIKTFDIGVNDANS